jgi:hypothetical protein
MDTIIATSSFSIVTRLQAGQPVNCGLILSRDRVFTFYSEFRVALGPTQSPDWLVQGAVSCGKAARAWS